MDQVFLVMITITLAPLIIIVVVQIIHVRQISRIGKVHRIRIVQLILLQIATILVAVLFLFAVLSALLLQTVRLPVLALAAPPLFMLHILMVAPLGSVVRFQTGRPIVIPVVPVMSGTPLPVLVTPHLFVETEFVKVAKQLLVARRTALLLMVFAVSAPVMPTAKLIRPRETFFIRMLPAKVARLPTTPMWVFRLLAQLLPGDAMVPAEVPVPAPMTAALHGRLPPLNLVPLLVPALTKCRVVCGRT